MLIVREVSQFTAYLNYHFNFEHVTFFFTTMTEIRHNPSILLAKKLKKK